jgi:hypothetical protein
MKKPMKKRKFYPRQVLQQLAGKATDALSEAQLHALQFFMLRTQRYEVMIALLQDAACLPGDHNRLDVAHHRRATFPPNLRVFVRPQIKVATVEYRGNIRL